MFETVHYHLTSEKLRSETTIVMLADLHNHQYGEENSVLLEEIRKNEPDLICIAGDMLIGNSRIPYDAGQKLVLSLAKEYAVFYGLGNHEARLLHDREIYGNRYEKYMEPILNAGVKVLIDSDTKIIVKENCFQIYGYDLPMKYFEKFNRYVFEEAQMKEALGACEKDSGCYQILLAHNPVYFRQYASWGADLTLSGHLHGGIIRLPLVGGIITPQAKLFPRYSAGCYTSNEKRMIVSKGLGTHTIPIRFNNRPELSVIHLSPQNNR